MNEDFVNALSTNFDTALEKLKEEYRCVIRLNMTLQKENAILKSEHYKDEEIAALRKKIDDHFKNNDFLLSDEAKEIKDEFMKNHCSKCESYKKSDQIKYIYTETHIADCVELECPCGERIELQWT